MNKKIKVIELFELIFNNKQIPQKILYDNEEYVFNKSRLIDFFNDEVEILEDNTEEIEELDNWFVDERKECREFDIQAINLCFSKHRDKINELVKTVNSIRKDLNK